MLLVHSNSCGLMLLKCKRGCPTKDRPLYTKDGRLSGTRDLGVAHAHCVHAIFMPSFKALTSFWWLAGRDSCFLASNLSFFCSHEKRTFKIGGFAQLKNIIHCTRFSFGTEAMQCGDEWSSPWLARMDQMTGQRAYELPVTGCAVAWLGWAWAGAVWFDWFICAHFWLPSQLSSAWRIREPAPIWQVLKASDYTFI